VGTRNVPLGERRLRPGLHSVVVVVVVVVVILP